MVDVTYAPSSNSTKSHKLVADILWKKLNKYMTPTSPTKAIFATTDPNNPGNKKKRKKKTEGTGNLILDKLKRLE